MTQESFAQYVYMKVVEVCEEMRPTEYIPNPKTRGRTSTGNMAFSAFQYIKISGKQIVIGIDHSIAPYDVYTEYPWTAKRWNNHKNPNEGWWTQRFFPEFARRLAIKLKGVVS